MRQMFSERDRELLVYLKKKFPGKAVTKSYLREHAALLNNKSQYTFSFLQNQNGNVDLPEQKLGVTDLFVCNVIGFFLWKNNAATKPFTNELITYPNPAYFVAAAGFVPQDLEAIYNGDMKVQINQSVIYDNLDMKRFRQVNQTEQSAVNAKDQQGNGDGFIESEPNLLISGANKLEVTVTLPNVPGIQMAAVAPDETNYLVGYLQGFFVPNGSQVGLSETLYSMDLGK